MLTSTRWQATGVFDGSLSQTKARSSNTKRHGEVLQEATDAAVAALQISTLVTLHLQTTLRGRAGAATKVLVAAATAATVGGRFCLESTQTITRTSVGTPALLLSGQPRRQSTLQPTLETVIGINPDSFSKKPHHPPFLPRPSARVAQRGTLTTASRSWWPGTSTTASSWKVRPVVVAQSARRGR